MRPLPFAHRKSVQQLTTLAKEMELARDLSLKYADFPPPRSSDDPDPSGIRLQRRLRVLVADDEPLVGAALRRALRGHDVTIVGGGAAAIAAIGGAEFDVVLCDVMMPDLSGPRVYEAVRSTRPAMLERFVFITGGVLHEGSRRFLSTIPNPVIYKPFDVHVVRELVHRTASPEGGAGA